MTTALDSLRFGLVFQAADQVTDPPVPDPLVVPPPGAQGQYPARVANLHGGDSVRQPPVDDVDGGLVLGRN